ERVHHGSEVGVVADKSGTRSPPGSDLKGRPLERQDVRMTTQQTPPDLGFDPDALRAKYREERDRRLRADANDQYVEVKGEFSHCTGGPYGSPGFGRAPLADEVGGAVMGGGFGGLLAGARLREGGVRALGLIERGGDFGGPWYWNRSPGAMCDVESYIYLP